VSKDLDGDRRRRRATRRNPVVPLINKCDVLKYKPGLTIAQYRIQSGVALEDFPDFLSVLEDNPTDIKEPAFAFWIRGLIS
jgi:hypothetical protein